MMSVSMQRGPGGAGTAVVAGGRGVGFLRQTGSIWYGWANLVIFAVLWLRSLARLPKTSPALCGRAAAWWSLAFFLAQPLIVLRPDSLHDVFCLVVMKLVSVLCQPE